MSEELQLLIARHKKEIWEWKKKESQWILDQNQLEGHKRVVDELSDKLIEVGKINIEHQRLNGRLQTRVTEVEDDNKRLSKQIEDFSRKLRRFGHGVY
tara:strand:+ start:44 stop:337 length:294 start_codon:yes stop_codon:yes gene_type:complete